MENLRNSATSDYDLRSFARTESGGRRPATAADDLDGSPRSATAVGFSPRPSTAVGSSSSASELGGPVSGRFVTSLASQSRDFSQVSHSPSRASTAKQSSHPNQQGGGCYRTDALDLQRPKDLIAALASFGTDSRAQVDATHVGAILDIHIGRDDLKASPSVSSDFTDGYVYGEDHSLSTPDGGLGLDDTVVGGSPYGGARYTPRG